MIVYLQMIETLEDKEKFESLYELYKNLMFYVANKILKNEHDAEDAVHQAFLSIVQNLSKISAADSPETRSYVVTITERKAIDIIRASKRDAGVDYDEAIGGIEVTMPGDSALADAILKLPLRYRELILLRFDNGYTTKEIATMFGMTPETVQRTLWRAKDALRKQLEREEAG